MLCSSTNTNHYDDGVLYSRVVLRPIDHAEDARKVAVDDGMGFGEVAGRIEEVFPGVWPGSGPLAEYALSALYSGCPDDFAAVRAWGFELVPMR